MDYILSTARGNTDWLHHIRNETILMVEFYLMICWQIDGSLEWNFQCKHVRTYIIDDDIDLFSHYLFCAMKIQFRLHIIKSSAFARFSYPLCHHSTGMFEFVQYKPTLSRIQLATNSTKLSIKSSVPNFFSNKFPVEFPVSVVGRKRGNH